jgi:hypothetical protein
MNLRQSLNRFLHERAVLLFGSNRTRWTVHLEQHANKLVDLELDSQVKIGTPITTLPCVVGDVNIFRLQIRAVRRRTRFVKPTICICCGEPMRPGTAALSRDPNLCGSCSALVDGMTDRETNCPDTLESTTQELSLAENESAPRDESHEALASTRST